MIMDAQLLYSKETARCWEHRKQYDLHQENKNGAFTNIPS